MHEQPDDPDDVRLEDAWTALEAGNAQAALDLASEVSPDNQARWILEASARLELDDLPGASDALKRASKNSSVEEDADLCWTAAEIALREWKLEEAKRLFEFTANLERTTPALGRLALCADAPRVAYEAGNSPQVIKDSYENAKKPKAAEA